MDDDRRIRDLLARYLSDHGYVVLQAEGSAQAEEILKRFECDAIILDVMMPGETGVEFARRYRTQSDTPILLLTALGETQDRITGLEAGADDYLAKPFEPRELILRLNAILKRTAKPYKAKESFKIGSWTFDPETESLHSDTDTVKLTQVEGLLIKALARSPGEAVSREELARRCDIDAGERTIDVQVTRLRRKIEADTKNPRYLQTIRGKGYMLRVEEI